MLFGRKRTIMQFGMPDLVWHKCSRCSAGTQHWNGERWGPFTKNTAMMWEGGTTIEPPQANNRKCPHCQLGGWWLDRNVK